MPASSSFICVMSALSSMEVSSLDKSVTAVRMLSSMTVSWASTWRKSSVVSLTVSHWLPVHLFSSGGFTPVSSHSIPAEGDAGAASC